MAVFAEKREIQFITVYVLAMLFLGISRETTRFIFPDTGDKVYTVINFYFVGAMALMAVISWLAHSRNIPTLPKVPPLWRVMVNFLIFAPTFYILFHIIFTGASSFSIPTMANFVIETAISFNENFIAFILLPTLLPWGTGTGSIAKGNIGIINYDIPTFNRIKYGLKSIVVITLLHVGSYSQNIRDFNDFYTVLIIAFVMFTAFYFLKETFSFGSSEAAHLSWNLTLISVRGSVI